MDDHDYPKLIRQLDERINGHEINEAVKELKALSLLETPPSHRMALAALAVRAARSDLAMKFLWKSVFGISRPDDEVLFEYAASLRKAGLVRQSLLLFGRLPVTPASLLQQAFCHIATWDYGLARDLLTEHASRATRTTKPFYIGQVNLAAALLYLGEESAADDVVKDILAICKDKYFQLYINCLELKGRIHFQRGDFHEAGPVFDKALELCSEQKSATALFIKKWALLNRLKAGELSVDSPEVTAFLKETREQGHWETLRDWDFQIAVLSANRGLLMHNYFGTPYEGFRRRSAAILAELPPPMEYPWMDPRSQTADLQMIDLYRPEQCGLELSPGKSLHRLLMTLCSDFYRPWTVERIFDHLFEGELFDPFSSHKRVYRQIEELKQILGDLPIEFRSTVYGYRVRPNPGGCLITKPRLQFTNSEEFFLQCLESAFGAEPFGRPGLEKLELLTPSQWQRHLRRLSLRGRIAVEGQGKATRYRIVS